MPVSSEIRKAALSLILSALLVMAAGASAWAKNVTFAWDANNDASVTGYKLYYRAGGNPGVYNGTGIKEGSSPIKVGNVTTKSLTGLDASQAYCFTVTAYNATGAESGYSEEVCTTAEIPVLGGSVGRLSLSGDSQTVLFTNPGSTVPVIIAGVPTMHDAGAGSVRVRAVTRNSFNISFQEWSYLDGSHGSENIPYLTLAPGRFVMGDGTIWEVGSFDLGKSGNKASVRVPFLSAYDLPPTVFLTVQTANDPAPLKALVSKVSKNGFVATLAQEQSLAKTDHGTETVGYLAVYTPTRVGKELKASGQVVISGATLPYLLRTWNVTSQVTPVFSQGLLLQEELSFDEEVAHRREPLAVLALGDKLFAQSQKADRKDVASVRRLAPEETAPMEWGTVSLVSQEDTVVPFARSYTNPVVVIKAVSQKASGPGIARVIGVQNNAFTVRFQDWDYLAGGSTAPKSASVQIFYMVVEAGQHNLNGLAVKAGTLSTARTYGAQGGSWQAVTFPAAFSQQPALFTSVMSVNAASAVTSRSDNVRTSGFDVALQEEEGADGSHVAETIGWIAIAQGSTRSINGKRIDVSVLPGAIGSKAATLSFSEPYDSAAPMVIADISSAVEADPGTLRIKKMQSKMMQLFFQEEKSGDRERSHAQEDLSLFIAE